MQRRDGDVAPSSTAAEIGIPARRIYRPAGNQLQYITARIFLRDCASLDGGYHNEVTRMPLACANGRSGHSR